ncbi:MAG: hypothetical protein DRP09_04185 [Candidatus Thorarchaeota archaeon]|nr:MAG: hypothetical protein DRP09_04185 [Candidatus Thorarchaeota archaeon]
MHKMRILESIACFVIIFFVVGSSFLAIHATPIAATTGEPVSSSSLVSQTSPESMSDEIWQASSSSDDRLSLVDFLGRVEQLGGTLVNSDECHTAYLSTAGDGLRYTVKTIGNTAIIDVAIGSYSLLSYSFDEGVYSTLVIDGTQLSSQPGAPALPYTNLVFTVPHNAHVLGISTRTIDSEQLNGLSVMPSPEPLALYEGYERPTSLFFDTDVYSTDSFTRSDILSHQTLTRAGEKTLLLSVYPVKYNPSRKLGELDLRTQITIEFDQPISTQELGVSPPGHSDTPGGNYTVIARESYLSSLETFVAWKESLGFDVFVETLEDIYAQYPSGDGPLRVRNYLMDSYTQNHTEYVLLVGDADVIPVREVVDPASGPGLDNGTEPSDLYYECLDGDWDANANGLYGEMTDNVDFLPELKVGRIPVQTTEQARNVLARIVDYERDPEPGDWMDDFMLIANDCFGAGDGPVLTEAFLNQMFLYDSFFDVFRYYSTDDSLTVENVMSKVNSGVGIMDFFDHGAYDVWVGALGRDDVLNMTNGNRSMLAFAMACETAAFDVESVEPTIAENFFRNPNGGAHTYIGATRVAWASYDCFDGFHNKYWEYFFEDAIAGRSVNPKEAMQRAQEYMITTFDVNVSYTRETIYQAIYFGDPSLRMYWKHDVETSVEPVETRTETTLNGTALCYNGAFPVSGTTSVRIVDPTGTEVFSGVVTIGPSGNFSVVFNTSDIPGLYRVYTHSTGPFDYTAETTFEVGLLTCNVTLDSDPIYGTLLHFSGHCSEDSVGAAILMDAEHSVINQTVISCTGGTYSGAINVTAFGNLRLVVSLGNGTFTGGCEIGLKVSRGDVLIIADNTGQVGMNYPGGWASDNSGDSSSEGEFELALRDEYNVTVINLMGLGTPTIDLLNEFDAVVVTTGDCFGFPLTSPDSYLLDILESYAYSGGNVLFEGSSIFTSLTNPGDRSAFGNLVSAEYSTRVTNLGALYLQKKSHPIMSGLPTSIYLEDGLGTYYVEVVTAVNSSLSVATYQGDYTGPSAITAVSNNGSRGAAIFIGFSIDAISNETLRNTLIQNSLAFLLEPTLLVTLSDDAMRSGTSERIDIVVEDAATGTPVSNALVTFSGCGVSVSNYTGSGGECSVYLSPISQGSITVKAVRSGYLNYSTVVIVYETPVLALSASPRYIDRTPGQKVTFYASDFYERFPLENCFINVTGLGNSVTGFTNQSGMLDIVLTPDSPGLILVTANLTGYVNTTLNIPVKITALVLPSFGTASPDQCCWDELMLHWDKYGEYPLDIDYETYSGMQNITLSTLEAVGADVLILSIPQTALSEAEITAIRTYVEQGHGFVSSFGSLYYNPLEFSEMFGLAPLLDPIVEMPDDFNMHIVNTTHPLTVDISEPYYPGYPLTLYQSSTGWSSDILRGASYAAYQNISLRKGAIVVFRGMVFFSNVPEYTSNTDDCQLFYNSITWSEYKIPDHDLAVSVDAPLVGPGETANITVVGRNVGLSNESNVDITLYVNGAVVSSLNIPLFLTGTTEVLNYSWTPSVEGTYNITARITVVPGEDTLLNNMAQDTVFVREVHDYFMFEGPFQWYDAKTHGANLWLWGDDAATPLALPFAFPFYDEIFDTVYVSSNGWLSFKNDNPTDGVPVPYPTSDSRYPYAMAPLWADLYCEGNIFVWSTTEFVAIEYNKVTLSGGARVGTFEVVLFADGRLAFCYESLLDVPYGTVGLNLGDGVRYNSYPATDLSQASDFGIEFYYSQPEHEIALALGCPSRSAIGEPTDIEMVVFNVGSSIEYTVMLELFVDGVLEFSDVIDTLVQGVAYNHSILWTGTWQGFVNVTLAVSPVPGEFTNANNIATQMMYVSSVRDYVVIEDTYEWYDAVASGTNIGLDGDDVYQTISLPFTFPYYDSNFTWVAVSSNGWLSFNVSDPWEFINPAFPSDNDRFKYCLAPVWRDLIAQNNVYVWKTDDFVAIEFNDYYYLSGSLLGTFEVVLHADGAIQFNYLTMTSVYGATIGLNHGDGYHYNTIDNSYVSSAAGVGVTFLYDDAAAPVWVETPTNIVREAGTFFSYQLEASDDTFVSTYTVNDTILFSVTDDGLVTNNVRLHVGSYGLLVKAFDAFGKSVSAEFKVDVVDTTGPTWSESQVTDEIVSGQEYVLDVRAQDFSGVASYTVNSTFFSINETAYLKNTVMLGAGVYVFEVTAEDIYGNTNSLTIVLTVLQSSDQMFILTMALTFGAISVIGLSVILIIRKKISARDTG